MRGADLDKHPCNRDCNVGHKNKKECLTDQLVLCDCA